MTKKKPTTNRNAQDNSDHSLLENRLRLLRLPTMLSEFPKTAQRCASENATYEAYLSELAGLDLDHRDSNAQSRRIKAAKVPATKELADFKFTHVPKLNKAKVLELSGSAFIQNQTNVVMLGPPGVGKPQPPQYPVGHRGMRGRSHGHGPQTSAIRQNIPAFRAGNAAGTRSPLPC